jgi:hypothetical protein
MRGLSLRSAVVTRAGERWRLDIALAGSESAVERSARELASLAGDNQARADRDEPVDKGPIGVRITTLPSKLPALLERLPTDAPFVAYPTLGVVRMRLRDEGELPTLMAMGAVVEDAPPQVKRGIDVFGPEPSSLPLMRSIKAQLDPNCVLSPGRFVGRL